MRNTTWKRLLGLVLAIPAGCFVPVFLFARGAVERRKGFPAPLIDSLYVPAAFACGAVCVVGVFLFLCDSRDPGSRTHDTKSSDEVDMS